MAIVRTIGETIKSGTASYIKKDEIDAPFTTIQKRAKVSHSLQALMGNARIHVNSVNKLISELGPNGEFVYEPDNGDARVRFVGDWNNTSTNHGTHIATIEDGAYLEVTFYGTGLNLVMQIDNGTLDLKETTDGGSESGNLLSFTPASPVLAARNYKNNQILAVKSGLSLGLHTVKLRNDASINTVKIYGVEILNESTQLTVNAGESLVGGLAAKATAQQLFDLSPAELTGTKGGRVVTYKDEDGNFGQATQVVDPAVTEGDPTELVTNGTFDTDTDWTKQTGWTIVGGVASCDGTQAGASYLFQATSYTI